MALSVTSAAKSQESDDLPLMLYNFRNAACVQGARLTPCSIPGSSGALAAN